MIDRRASVTCYISPAHDLYHLSNILTGLCELANEGRIELRLEAAEDDARQPLASVAMHAVAVQGERHVDVVFEMFDRGDDFHLRLLADCDIYFKRSYYVPAIRKLKNEWQAKVVPFGFNYGCRSMAADERLRATNLGTCVLNRYLLERPFESFEQCPSTGVSASVLFQTRAWAPESISDDADEINESRARTIRALRKAFPGRFHGGFMHNDYACERYPDLLTEHSSDEDAYARLMKRHLIGISTHGLHYSVPFKIPEYLAASVAVVSEPLRNGFPVPFIAGRHFLSFREPDECIAQCDCILTDPHLAAELRHMGWQYYQSQVRPAQHAASLLEHAFSGPR